MLRRKLGDQADTILAPQRLREAMRFFETSIKYVFNPCSESCDTPSIKLEDGFLQLTKLHLIPLR